MESINLLAVFIVVLTVISLLGLPVAGIMTWQGGRYKTVLGLALAIGIAWVIVMRNLGLGLSDFVHVPGILGFLVAWTIVLFFSVAAREDSRGTAT